ncbi:MAG: hypothetical protein AAF937_05880 [Planctomycetota bacterium]
MMKIAVAFLSVVVAAGVAHAQPRFIPIGDIPGGLTLGRANAVSADGTVVAGDGRPLETTIDSFRWTEAEGMQVLPRLPGGSF